ncbi:hypothetical protein, partial [Acinetobacter baumannii]
REVPRQTPPPAARWEALAQGRGSRSELPCCAVAPAGRSAGFQGRSQGAGALRRSFAANVQPAQATQHPLG